MCIQGKQTHLVSGTHLKKKKEDTFLSKMQFNFLILDSRNHNGY